MSSVYEFNKLVVQINKSKSNFCHYCINMYNIKLSLLIGMNYGRMFQLKLTISKSIPEIPNSK